MTVAFGVIITIIIILLADSQKDGQDLVEARLTINEGGSESRLLIALPDDEVEEFIDLSREQDASSVEILLMSPVYFIPDSETQTGELSFIYSRNAPSLSSLDLFCLIDGNFVFIPSRLDYETGEVTADRAEGLCGLFSVDTLADNHLFSISESGEGGGAGRSLSLIDVSDETSSEPLTYISHVSYLSDPVLAEGATGVLLDLRSGVLSEDIQYVLSQAPEQIVAYLPAGFESNPALRPFLSNSTFFNRIDWFLVDISALPSGFVSDGQADALLSSLTRLIDRRRIIPVVSASPMLLDAATPVSDDTPFISRLGGLEFASSNTPVGDTFTTAEEIFPFSGLTEIPLVMDPMTGVYAYEIISEQQEEMVFLNDLFSLRRRIDFIREYDFKAVGLSDMASRNGDLLEFTSRLLAGSQYPEWVEPQVELSVTDADGKVVTQSTHDPGTRLSWKPEMEGQYHLVVAMVLPGIRWETSGSLRAISASSMVSQQEGVVVGAPSSLASGSGASLNLNLPAPVYPAGVAANGKFELGGQVNHSIDNQAYMDQAGMTWVKFQIGWHADEVPDSAIQKINLAHSLGYKVLLSIVSTEKYPTGIDIPAYLSFLRTVAGYGPDAIEVWNEPNLDYEWPHGEISGANYVSWLLAPSYNAIKKVDPSIIVISAAPAPNGAFFGEGGCSAEGYGCDDWLFVQQMAQAGAVNYMDCVGVHYNAGATSPTVSEGHPADPGFKHYSWYYSSMLQLYSGTFGRPVCFTELGYLSPAGLGELPGRFSWGSDTTLMEQSMWLAEAAQLSRDSGLVRLMIVWNVDFTYWGDDPMAGYAIVRLSGDCPACQTLGAVMTR